MCSRIGGERILCRSDSKAHLRIPADEIVSKNFVINKIMFVHSFLFDTALVLFELIV